jgi:hypothetical protein
VGDRRLRTSLIDASRVQKRNPSADPERLEITCRARHYARPDRRRPHVAHRPFRLVACPQSVETMNDLRVRVIETVMAAVRIAQDRAAAAHTVGNEAEADRFETEVREAEQRLVRLGGFQDQLEPPRNDYLS